MYKIRFATPEDILLLQGIETAAGALFLQYEFTAHLAADLTPIEDFEQAQKDNLLWVAVLPSGEAIGFALVYMLDGEAHLQELAVHPGFGRQGVGTTLVQTILEWARTVGIPSVTLTTFRDIPWNEPFYRKLGFRSFDDFELTTGLREVVEKEEHIGLDRNLRVVMKIETTSA